MDINLDVLADSLKNLYTWVVIIIAAVSGIIGGLAHKLTRPSTTRHLYGFMP